VTLAALVGRLLHPPRAVGVSRDPLGWLAITRGHLEPVLGWAVYESGQAVGLVPGRRGLRSVTGWRFGGYLPPNSRGAVDVQREAPAVALVAGDLTEAIGALAYTWTKEAQLVLYDRLRAASDREWAGAALLAFITDPDAFRRRYLERFVEHLEPAHLDAHWRAGLAAITESSARAGTQEDHQ
jgi:hypothetical protein